MVLKAKFSGCPSNADAMHQCTGSAQLEHQRRSLTRTIYRSHLSGDLCEHLEGRWKARITRPEDSIYKWSYKSSLGLEGRGFESPRGRSAFHVSNLAIINVQCIMPILEPIEPTNDIIVAIGLYQFVNHCNMCEIFMIVWLLYFTLQKI